MYQHRWRLLLPVTSWPMPSGPRVLRPAGSTSGFGMPTNFGHDRPWVALAVLATIAVVRPAFGDDKIKAQVLGEYQGVKPEYARYFVGKRVSGVVQHVRPEGKIPVTHDRYELWTADEVFRRLDTTNLDPGSERGSGARVSYVLNDYFTFGARELHGSNGYSLFLADMDGPNQVRRLMTPYLEPFVAGYCVESLTLDELLATQGMVPVSAGPATWNGLPCRSVKIERRNLKTGAPVWSTEVFYQTRPTPPTWRSLGYRAVGRNKMNDRKTGATEEWVNTFDDAVSPFIPSKAERRWRNASDPKAPLEMVDEFVLESVTPDDRPRSFFTLSAFGIPEPGETGVRVPWYRQAWVWVAGLAAVAVAVAAVIAVRRRRSAV